MLHDLRAAVRAILKDRWLAAAAIVALALGIGVNATVFTLVNAVLIRGLPFPDSANLYVVGTQRTTPDGRAQINPASYQDLQDWRSQASSFADMAAFTQITVNLADDRAMPEQTSGARVSENLFRLLGQQPLLGRDFSPADGEARAERVVVLGNALWQNRYGADPGVLGKAVRINGEPAVIVGDLSRPQAMTVEWIRYAQGLTAKWMKGMLTGPVTMLMWSFPREDLPREVQARQLALAAPEQRLALEWLKSQNITAPELALAQTGNSPLLAVQLAAQDYWQDRDVFLRHIASPRFDPLGVAEQIKDYPVQHVVSWLQKWSYDLAASKFLGIIRYNPDRETALAAMAKQTDGLRILRFHREMVRLQRSVNHPLNARLFIEQLMITYADLLQPAPRTE